MKMGNYRLIDLPLVLWPFKPCYGTLMILEVRWVYVTSMQIRKPPLSWTHCLLNYIFGTFFFVCIDLTLSPPYKLSSAKFLVCFSFQSASMKLKVVENIVWVSNGVLSGSKLFAYGTLVVLCGLRVKSPCVPRNVFSQNLQKSHCFHPNFCW